MTIEGYEELNNIEIKEISPDVLTFLKLKFEFSRSSIYRNIDCEDYPGNDSIIRVLKSLALVYWDMSLLPEEYRSTPLIDIVDFFIKKCIYLYIIREKFSGWFYIYSFFISEKYRNDILEEFIKKSYNDYKSLFIKTILIYYKEIKLYLSENNDEDRLLKTKNKEMLDSIENEKRNEDKKKLYDDIDNNITRILNRK